VFLELNPDDPFDWIRVSFKALTIYLDEIEARRGKADRKAVVDSMIQYHWQW
jgi:hypothetical protein